MIDKELLEILACPKCKSPVKEENNKLICQNPDCGLRYPIRDGIPIMLIEEAEKPQRQ
ncbi:MAG: Trm112 family protein [Verrucomicrobiae bacterium]|nr:Trm112 family protein [Verrucomicrobiae bacterium]